MQDKKDELTTCIRAGFSCIQLLTSEEDRAVATVMSIAKKDLATVKNPQGYKLWSWVITRGLYDEDNKKMTTLQVFKPDGNGVPVPTLEPDIQGKSKDPSVALQSFMAGSVPTSSIVIMKDFHVFLKQPNPMLLRILKDAIAFGRQTKRHLVIVGCVINTQPELEKDIRVIELPLPGRDELTSVAKSIAKSAKMEINGETEAVVSAMTGLTTNEAADAAAFSVKKCKKLNPEIIGKIKTDTIKRNGVVEVVEANVNIESVGGLSAIKSWLTKRVRGFTKEAEEFGLAKPKGLLAIGISGTGKSLIAKTVAGILKVPMLRLDGGKIYGHLVGDSERNMRTALRTAEVMAPCVLFVDEIEKAMAGAESSGQCDGGTTSRVVGTFLQWLQDKTAPVFVVATANDVSKLPPEILRRGRFDQIFFVDLPSPEERMEIWKIHIEKIGRKASDYDLQVLADSTDGYTGAEIESVVSDGMFNAFHEGVEPTTEIFAAAVTETVPLSSTMREKITSMRRWAEGRAINASTGRTTEKKNETKG